MSERSNALRTVVRLVVASLVIGLVLSVAGVTPLDVLDNIAEVAIGLWDMTTGAIGWAGSYIVLGALVVVPLWLVLLAWRRLGRRDG
ncbi:MAG: DUF6460 domain-containing protein [Gammaproteobacteria bacterium]|nr:DUF6460 domain-containing protein [Gammaproteobacteria bacterium]